MQTNIKEKYSAIYLKAAEIIIEIAQMTAVSIHI
jgi:hypothetical protein